MKHEAPQLDFPFVAEVPVNKTTAEIQQERLAAWKKEQHVWVLHTAEMTEEEEPYYALAVEAAHEMLEGYDLTDEQKANHVLLMASYCRLLEESGVSATGRTELEACERLADQLKMLRP